MTEVAEATDFDTEFDAAREADVADEAGIETPAEEGEGGPVAEEADPEQTKGEQDPDKLARQVLDTNRALKESRRATRELKDQMTSLQERLEAAERKPVVQQQQTAVSVEGMPDPNADPIGALEWMRNHVQRQEQAQQAQAQQTESQRQEQRQNQAFAERIRGYESDFTEDHADYPAAAEHLKATRVEELQEAGFAGDDLNRALQNDMRNIVSRAMAAGKDPAEVVYSLAKKRGFGVDKGATKLQTIAKGQASSRSMPVGGRPSGHLPVEQGVKLKGAAFDKWYESEKQRAKAG